MARLLVCVSLLMLLAGCGGSSGSAAPAPSGVRIGGQVTFDLVPVVAGHGLAYDQTTAQPARGVTVELLQGTTVLASTTTDALGSYSFGNVAMNTDVALRVRAEMLRVGTPSWDFKVVDNVNNGALYTLAGAVFNTGSSDVTRNLHAESGWTGSAYTAPRAAAPFAILDVAYDAVQLVLTAAPDTAFPALKFNWSTANVPVAGPGPGEITSTRFRPSVGILLVGAADQDTDEYDRHVIAHEFGHYLEHSFSRSDSIAGPHALTHQLDMRVAFGEAWGSAFAAMATGDPIYVDTHSAGQAMGFSFDLEQSPNRQNPNPGWFSEESLQSLLFDLYDNGRDLPPDWFVVDDLELGFPPLWDAFVNELRTTHALTSVFPFVDALKRANPAEAPQIDNLTASQRIDTVIDEYGTGQKNFGNPAGRAQQEVLLDFSTVYDALTVGATLDNVCSLDDYNTIPPFGGENKLGSRRFVRFTVTNPGVHTITARARAPINAPADPDLVLHFGAEKMVSEGESACSVSTPASCVETFSPTLEAGDYVLEVYEWTNTNPIDDPEYPPIGRTCFDVTVTRP